MLLLACYCLAVSTSIIYILADSLLIDVLIELQEGLKMLQQCCWCDKVH
jgi:hypothetical protein